MPLLPFETCRERIERAKTHRKAFADTWNEISTEGEPYNTVLHIEDDGTGGIWIEPWYERLPTSLSLDLGEFLYQLRSTLDACIYAAAIVESGQDPPPKEQNLEFPICACPDDFKKARWKIAPLKKKRRDIIESVQPYKAPPDLQPDLQVLNIHRTFAMLNDWARKDRHRRLHVVGGWASNASPKLYLPDGIELEWIMVAYDGLLEHESKIATFKLRGFTPGAKVKANPDVLSM
jgi:hypothetical protein